MEVKVIPMDPKCSEIILLFIKLKYKNDKIITRESVFVFMEAV